MKSSYVLISCDAGMEKSVLAQLQKIHGVNEIQRLRGQYEIIVKVEANTADHVTSIIGWKIQKMTCVRSVISLTVKDHSPT